MNTHALPRGIIRKILAGLHAVFVALGIAVALLAGINGVAAYFLEHSQQPRGPSLFDHMVWPSTAAGTELLKRIFHTSSDAEALERINTAPQFEMHPILHYMTARTDNRHYRIGVEGIRYDQGWDDATVRAMLSARKDLIFLMGGSTMLGHGVSGNETISWYLNNRTTDPKEPKAVNFGAQAYDQHRELEKLVYLLRSGYRPTAVVFLDGWNDLLDVSRSNMRWQDKVIFHGFSANRGTIAFTPGATNVEYGRLFAESLPILRWKNSRDSKSFSIDDLIDLRDPFLKGFDFREAEWTFVHWEQFAARQPGRLKEQLLESYRANTAFLKGLSEAFGFKLVILLQPMGLFEERNPFVLDGARQNSTYRTLADLRAAVREAISAGRLKMVDASNALNEIGEDRYVDVAHYSPAANEALAASIRRLLATKSP